MTYQSRVRASSAGLEHRKLFDANMLKLDSQLLNANSKQGSDLDKTLMLWPCYGNKMHDEAHLLCIDHNVKTKLVFPDSNRHKHPRQHSSSDSPVQI